MNFYRKAVVLVSLFGVVIGGLLLAPAVSAQDKIPKMMLIKLTLDQTSTLCASETFTQCMGFTENRCNELAETAIEQCLMPLPEEIDPKLLQNESLEQCPQEVYAKEGFSEEKARECFEQAMGAETTGADAQAPKKSSD